MMLSPCLQAFSRFWSSVEWAVTASDKMIQAALKRSARSCGLRAPITAAHMAPVPASMFQALLSERKIILPDFGRSAANPEVRTEIVVIAKKPARQIVNFQYH